MAPANFESNINTIDPFTISEYRNLVRIIQIYALEKQEAVQKEGQSFLLNQDIIIDTFLFIDGIFTSPVEMKKKAVSLRIKKGSYYEREESTSSHIMTETVSSFTLEKKDSSAQEIDCHLTSEASYIEKKTPTLLSKNKVFIEKTYKHNISLMDKSMNNELVYSQEGFCKIDAATGYIVEER